MYSIICELSISEPTPYLRKHLAAELGDEALAAELLEKREATIDPDFFDGTDPIELDELSYLSECCIGTLSENFPGVSFKVVCYYSDFSAVWRAHLPLRRHLRHVSYAGRQELHPQDC